MHARIFTPEDATGFSAEELAEMNAAYGRLSALARSAPPAPPRTPPSTSGCAG